MSTELKTLGDSADLVRKYATSLANDQRAQQFYSQISIMAQQNPKLRSCTPQSMMTAMMACVHLDLMPNTPEQLAFVIPYGDQAQFQLGYKGLVKLAYRSGDVRSITAELVFKGDKFNHREGLNPILTHHIGAEVDRTKYEDVVAAYAIAKLENGEKVFTVMYRAELDKIQKTAKAQKDDSPWKMWPESMAKKTVVKRLVKLLPSSNTDKSDLAIAAQIDSMAEVAKLGYDQETQQFVELEGVSDQDLEAERERRVAAAEKKYQERLLDTSTGASPEVEPQAETNA